MRILFTICLLLLNFVLTAQQSTVPIARLDGEFYSMPQLLSRYVQIASVSGQEREAGNFLVQLAVENGLAVQTFGSTNSNYNVAASLYPLSSGLPNIVLLNHMDVVPPGDTSLWEHPPFSGHVEAGEVWGRGAFDNKGMPHTVLKEHRSAP